MVKTKWPCCLPQILIVFFGGWDCEWWNYKLFHILKEKKIFVYTNGSEEHLEKLEYAGNLETPAYCM